MIIRRRLEVSSNLWDRRYSSAADVLSHLTRPSAARAVQLGRSERAVFAQTTVLGPEHIPEFGLPGDYHRAILGILEAVATIPGGVDWLDRCLDRGVQLLEDFVRQFAEEEVPEAPNLQDLGSLGSGLWEENGLMTESGRVRLAWYLRDRASGLPLAPFVDKSESQLLCLLGRVRVTLPGDQALKLQADYPDLECMGITLASGVRVPRFGSVDPGHLGFPAALGRLQVSRLEFYPPAEELAFIRYPLAIHLLYKHAPGTDQLAGYTELVQHVRNQAFANARIQMTSAYPPI